METAVVWFAKMHTAVKLTNLGNYDKLKHCGKACEPTTTNRQITEATHINVITQPHPLLMATFISTRHSASTNT